MVLEPAVAAHVSEGRPLWQGSAQKPLQTDVSGALMKGAAEVGDSSYFMTSGVGV